ncbi:signal peptidase II [Ferrimonas lipolytica]|uniref:Lipoprotein signal peptidase n=1 Tax=Ferrimonas lipolytica TaxID=2724191 RepID=A0A6H1UA41_9GAMM|nr:signal peptidase II [Ferrimonas lipolytica]QIZ75499.1 signal peptidase II [Ferrimonas lipolytica]
MLKEAWANRPAQWTRSGCAWLWLAVISLLADQATKLWVAANFDYGVRLEFIPYVNLTYVHNPGAAFSFLADAGGWQRWGFAIFATIVSVALIAMLRAERKENKMINISYALIISGAIGNLIDRVAYGYVIDFIDFFVGNWHWPAFNIADSAICIGAVLMILDSLLQPKQPKEAQ